MLARGVGYVACCEPCFFPPPLDAAGVRGLLVVGVWVMWRAAWGGGAVPGAAVGTRARVGASNAMGNAPSRLSMDSVPSDVW